ncbi:hypothetical protein B0H15DRAFT_819927 [Mycena belliarum]|uniref:Uncharacterized protein n=1 Tax=Mycena belliarum TaxID=1033014 RepID=A0AAD6UJV6_9AGAR|nr:hypothetical protein B0H15DRAFT_819927 [Mycena belliae]
MSCFLVLPTAATLLSMRESYEDWRTLSKNAIHCISVGRGDVTGAQKFCSVTGHHNSRNPISDSFHASASPVEGYVSTLFRGEPAAKHPLRFAPKISGGGLQLSLQRFRRTRTWTNDPPPKSGRKLLENCCRTIVEQMPWAPLCAHLMMERFLPVSSNLSKSNLPCFHWFSRV